MPANASTARPSYLTSMARGRPSFESKFESCDCLFVSHSCHNLSRFLPSYLRLCASSIDDPFLLDETLFSLELAVEIEVLCP